jgi:phage FluMu gp28-like protein
MIPNLDSTHLLVKKVVKYLLEYLDLPAATDDPSARWEGFQFEHLHFNGLLAITCKSRQVGWSWLAAAEAVATGYLTPRTTSIFVSLNHDEAAEKIRYARQIVEALQPELRPRLVIDSRLELEFDNGSRLISHLCRPVRGKAKAFIYLDEFAHYPNDRAIYTAALPATSKGGHLRIGSSPLGASGLIWELYTQKLRAYPGYARTLVPWWRVRALCHEPPEALKVAPTVLTAERVGRYGTPRLREIFENLALEDFQQEYECAWVDESVAWITWEEIKRNQSAEHVCLTAVGMEEAFRAINDLAGLAAQYKIETSFAGGMDIGRTRNTTEIFFVGCGAAAGTPLRLMITLDNTEFDAQEAVLRKALSILPVTKMLLDRTGLGMQLAENAVQRHGSRAEGVQFTNETKELWSVELKVQMPKGHVPLPLDRDLSYQIHSIKKKVTEAKNVVFDMASNEKHHADKYWALALAVWAARPGQSRQLEYGPNILANYRG